MGLTSSKLKSDPKRICSITVVMDEDGISIDKFEPEDISPADAVYLLEVAKNLILNTNE